ncbi:MAG: TonB-dependent receptor [Deltaproteobacteria bacterium]|nr:TonB-dependent receptor [Deltaproteobacteria bacterium]
MLIGRIQLSILLVIIFKSSFAAASDTESIADTDTVIIDTDNIDTDNDLADLNSDNYEEFETVVESQSPPGTYLENNRAVTKVSKEQIDFRQPRSAPDALRFEPGAFVQQSAHSQGSVYTRGLTGQQTLLLFDGIRLNNSTYRQGPNQYFFTLDSGTIDSIYIMRGGGSTSWGSDALGGVILTKPIEPVLNTDFAFNKFKVTPKLIIKMASQDHSGGFRLESNIAYKKLAFYGGAGLRTADELKSGGTIYGVDSGKEPLVPRFEKDGKTQKGTGFDEFTADGALVYRLSDNSNIKLAAYTYRQFNAPRTDRCPSAYAPYNECFTYDQQFRDLVYTAFTGEKFNSVADELRITLSWQRQHEEFTLDKPLALAFDNGINSVNTAGTSLKGSTRDLWLSSYFMVDMDYGIDTYFDVIDSHSYITLTDIGYHKELSRGQYLDGSTYLYGGLFLNGTVDIAKWIRLSAGGRFSWIGANADGDPESGSSPVNRTWTPFVYNASLTVATDKPVSLVVNYDKSFRAPNLDDLTSRQQTGPGFQFENAGLKPENADTYEAGLKFSGIFNLELWGFITKISDAIVRSPREADECPPDTPSCNASWNRFQLENADDLTIVKGVEAFLFTDISENISSRATVSWTYGEGPNTADPPSDPSAAFNERIPLSRVPPLNGTVELLWKNKTGLSAGTALRWAAPQTRLALSDISDERIPKGGTPWFAVMDLRLSYRPNKNILTSLTFENIFDTAYRYHGSSVNGPGRGLMLTMSIDPVWQK